MTANYIIETSIEEDKFIPLVKEEKEKSTPSYRRYPIRFILVDNFKNMRKLIEIMKKNEVETLDLSSLENFQDNDGWITTYKIIDIIKKLPEEKDYIIFPISEILRFLDNAEFYSFLTSLMNIENNDYSFKRRIYIPILGLSLHFQNSFLDKYYKRSEFSFVWQVGNDYDKFKLIFFEFSPEIEGATIVHTTKEFLDLWKKSDIFPNILVSSKYLCYLGNRIVNDEIFNSIIIKNTKEFIEKFLEINIPMEYKGSEDYFWKNLLEKIKGKDSFEAFVKGHLNVMDLDDFEKTNPLSLWLNKDDNFTRWIIKNYYSNIEKDCYTKIVFNSLLHLNNEELLKNYYLKIFDGKPNKDFLEERRNILQEALKNKKLDLKFIESDLEEKINSLSPEEALNYITNTTFFEKKWIIENIDHIKQDLETIYPELSFYLEDIVCENLSPENTWINEYFKEYRISRIKNSISPRLKEILEEKNANKDSFFKWYYSFKPVTKYIEDDEYTKIWIDALGVEFLPLIISLLKEEGFNVDFNIGIVNLPSTTEFNMFEGVDRIPDLDNFIHNQYSYFYPDNIIREIEIIKNIVDSIIKNKERVLIFSDHGFTAFANTKFDGKKILGVKVAEKEGRYAEVIDDKEVPKDEDFFVYLSEEGGKYLIATKHKFFSEISNREIHGGATPEEVLVPVIYASKVERKKEEYKIELLREEIDIRTPVLELTIKPNPEKVSFFLKDKRLKADFDNDKKIYKINLSGYRSGNYVLTVKIERWKEVIEFRIKGGLKENELL